LRQQFGSLLAWAVALGAITFLMAAAISAIGPAWLTVVAKLPPQELQFFGGRAALLSGHSWLTAMIISGFAPLLVAIWAALAAVDVVASDRDNGSLEFVLALPVGRSRLLAERTLSLLVQLLCLHAVIWAGGVLGLNAVGQSVDPGRFAAALGVLYLTQAALACMIVLLSLAFRDQVRATLSAVVAAVVFVTLPSFVEPNAGDSFLRGLSPFAYTASGYLTSGTNFPWGHVATLAVWAAVALLVALNVFARQEA